MIVGLNKGGGTDICSNILTPLETIGGNSFSLEGFEKMLITILNFTQGDLHSTGGIQISLLWVYNSTGWIHMYIQGVFISTELEEFIYLSTGGIKISFLRFYNSAGGIQISFQGVYNSTGGI